MFAPKGQNNSDIVNYTSSLMHQKLKFFWTFEVCLEYFEAQTTNLSSYILFFFIKSPQYTGCDFMFLYRFVRRRRRRRRRRSQILVHAITFEQLLGFLSFLAQLLALTCRLPDYIFVDFRRDLDLDFSRSNMEFAISQPKMVRLPRNEKQT